MPRVFGLVSPFVCVSNCLLISDLSDKCYREIKTWHRELSWHTHTACARVSKSHWWRAWSDGRSECGSEPRSTAVRLFAFYLTNLQSMVHPYCVCTALRTLQFPIISKKIQQPSTVVHFSEVLARWSHCKTQQSVWKKRVEPQVTYTS